MTATLVYVGSLEVTSCWCGIGLAVPSDLLRQARDRGRSIYCPLGHTFVFKDNDEVKRLDRALKFERDLRASIAAERDQAKASLRSTKGVVTKLRKATASGSCPFCGSASPGPRTPRCAPPLRGSCHRDGRARRGTGVTTERRVNRLPSGRLVDEDTIEWWLRSMNKPTRKVERLSLRDPMCVQTEAESRDRRVA